MYGWHKNVLINSGFPFIIIFPFLAGVLYMYTIFSILTEPAEDGNSTEGVQEQQRQNEELGTSNGNHRSGDKNDETVEREGSASSRDGLLGGTKTALEGGSNSAETMMAPLTTRKLNLNESDEMHSTRTATAKLTTEKGTPVGKRFAPNRGGGGGTSNIGGGGHRSRTTTSGWLFEDTVVFRGLWG